MAFISGVTPSGVGRSMSAPAFSSDFTHSRQPERVAYRSGVSPPLGRYCARGSEVTWLPQSFTAARTSTSALCLMRKSTTAGLRASTAHISGVWSRSASRALTFAPALTSCSTMGNEPLRAASSSGVCPAALPRFGSALAFSSRRTSSASARFTASASAVAPSALRVSGLAPWASRSFTSAWSTRYTAQSSGVVPSPCCALTSAPSRIAASAASWSPPRIRPARSAAADISGSSAKATAVMYLIARIAAALHDGVGELVVVRPHALVGVIDELVRIRPGARQAVQQLRLLHVLGGEALAHGIGDAVEDLLHGIALGLHLRAGDHTAGGGNDPGLFTAHLQQPGLRIDAPSDPAALVPADHRIQLRRHGIADQQYIGVAEVHVKIAVSVRLLQVTVFDVLAAEGQLPAAGIDHLGGDGLTAAGLEITILPGHVLVHGHALCGLGMRDDLR